MYRRIPQWATREQIPEYSHTPRVEPGTSYAANAPLELCMSTGNPDLVEVLWDFGDGTTSSVSDVCHTWSDPGDVTLSLEYLPVDGCEWLDGGTVSFENLTDARWQMWDETDTEVWASGTWDAETTVDEPGTYRVMLTVSGLAGEVTGEGTFTIDSACRCSASGGSGGLIALLSLVGLWRRRSAPQST